MDLFWLNVNSVASTQLDVSLKPSSRTRDTATLRSAKCCYFRIGHLDFSLSFLFVYSFTVEVEGGWLQGFCQGSELEMKFLWHTHCRRQWHPLQCSCLENPMDGGAWWAAIYGVAEGQTRLSDFTFTFHFHALEKEMATHSSVLAWRIPGTEEPGRLQSMGSQRVEHGWATSLSLFTFTHWRRKWQPTPVFLPGESQGRGSLVGCRLWVAQGRTRLKWLRSTALSLIFCGWCSLI